MKTELSKFCGEFTEAIASFPRVLNETVEAIHRESSEHLLKRALAGLAEVKHRLKALTDKIYGQQSYLIIFGPLKSGKSTLMNAVSGAYVSEVTSLPGYPCLVYVGHGESQEFTVTRYNGRERSFLSSTEVQTIIGDGHVALADRIRECEGAGTEFDPRVHFPEAIRRVDVRLPVKALRESTTVLVDTPGLYSRMNFGYDLMTREFRNSAACAVFVVKADNLFLEQVFDEFNQLLGLFSRIFLVVNLDSQKCDLRPDGTLMPSAESRSPEKIVEAFQSLSMSAPLRVAHESGRLKIYTIDLLTAASRSIQRAKESNGVARAATPERNGTHDWSKEAEQNRNCDAFDEFLRDLGEYLNSTDYIAEFMKDSVRQALILCEETRVYCEPQHWMGFKHEQELLDRKLQSVDARLEALGRVKAFDWDGAFKPVVKENAAAAAELARAARERAGAETQRATGEWFESDESLKDLGRKHWNGILDTIAGELAAQTDARVREMVDTPLGGARVSPELIGDLHTLGMGLGGLYQSAMEELKPPHLLLNIYINESEISVNRTLADWLLLRDAGTLRRMLFGSHPNLDREIPKAAKAARLHQRGRLALASQIERHLQNVLPEAALECSDKLIREYIGIFRAKLDARLQTVHAALLAERASLQGPLEAHARVLHLMETLRAEAANTTQSIGDLAARHRCEPPAIERLSPELKLGRMFASVDIEIDEEIPVHPRTTDAAPARESLVSLPRVHLHTME